MKWLLQDWDFLSAWLDEVSGTSSGRVVVVEGTRY